MCPALLALVSPHQRLFVESELIDRGKANQPEKRNRKQQREPIKCCVFLHLHLFPSAISNFSYRNIRILTRHFSFFQSLCSAKLVSWMYFILTASVHIELFYRQSWEKKRFTCSSSFLQQYLPPLDHRHWPFVALYAFVFIWQDNRARRMWVHRRQKYAKYYRLGQDIEKVFWWHRKRLSDVQRSWI